LEFVYFATRFSPCGCFPWTTTPKSVSEERLFLTKETTSGLTEETGLIKETTAAEKRSWSFN
jgi:hypothetical protein